MTQREAAVSSHGPRLLFFSGGTALRGLSRELVRHAHRSIHLITPFDSGGSSAALRQALGIPAVGDLRNRMLALADVRTPERRRIHDLLAYRLPASAARTVLDTELRGLLAEATDEVRTHVEVCMDAVGPSFDLRYASVGNLALTGAYLDTGRNLDNAVRRFSEWVSAGGVVCSVSEDALHLAATLKDGTVVAGQHRITRGTEAGVARVFLTDSLEPATPRASGATSRALALVGEADLICYPVGSFFTSVIASFLPQGMGAAVAASEAPKVYVPNPGDDPEERGMSVADRVRALTEHLLRGAGEPTDTHRVLDTVLVDRNLARQEVAALRTLHPRLRVHVADLGLGGAPLRYDDGALLEALLALTPT